MLDLFYGAIAATSFLFALALVPVAERIGHRLGILDHPDPRKVHATPRVRCGGIGIYGAFVLGLVLALVAATLLRSSPFIPEALRPYLGNIHFVSDRLVAILAGATLMFLVGLADDRYNLRPGIKLGAQILSALPLILTGVTIRMFLPNPLLGVLFTIAWVVLLTNAFNFLDNMNGLSAGVAAICAFNFYLISRAGGEYFMMAIFALFFGALVGFLRYNFPSGRVFMGDSGSLFIGYTLAALSTLVTYYQEGVPTQVPVVAPIFVLGVPIFDTLSVLYIRWRTRAPLMKGDRNHFSHRLVALGFTPVRAVLFIYLVTFALGLSAVNLRWLNWTGAILALVQCILFFLIIFVLEQTARNGACERSKKG